MSKQSLGGCVFNKDWLTQVEFRLWISRSSRGPNSATCKLCKTEINIQTMGKSGLTSHTDSKKHKAKINELNATPSIATIFNNRSVTSLPRVTESLQTQSVAAGSSSTICPSESVASPTTIDQSSVTTSVAQNRKDVVAEIWWVFRVVDANSSFNSNGNISFVLGRMFSDCKTALNFSCGYDKARYILNYGVQKYCKSLLVDSLMNAPLPYFTILFDESES